MHNPQGWRITRCAIGVWHARGAYYCPHLQPTCDEPAKGRHLRPSTTLSCAWDSAGPPSGGISGIQDRVLVGRGAHGFLEDRTAWLLGIAIRFKSCSAYHECAFVWGIVTSVGSWDWAWNHRRSLVCRSPGSPCRAGPSPRLFILTAPRRLLSVASPFDARLWRPMNGLAVAARRCAVRLLYSRILQFPQNPTARNGSGSHLQNRPHPLFVAHQPQLPCSSHGTIQHSTDGAGAPAQQAQHIDIELVVGAPRLQLPPPSAPFDVAGTLSHSSWPSLAIASNSPNSPV